MLDAACSNFTSFSYKRNVIQHWNCDRFVVDKEIDLFVINLHVYLEIFLSSCLISIAWRWQK